MADTDRHDTPAAAPKDETRGEARRDQHHLRQGPAQRPFHPRKKAGVI